MENPTLEGMEQEVKKDVRALVHKVEGEAGSLISYCDLQQFSLVFQSDNDQLWLSVVLKSQHSLPANVLEILRDGDVWRTVNASERTDEGAHLKLDGPLESLLAGHWQAQLTIIGQGGEPMITEPVVLMQASEFTGSSRFPERELPQFKAKTDYGVCFSGGGSRSMALSIGQMRGLDNQGLLDKAGYTSSVSGGSWAATAFSYKGSVGDQARLIGQHSTPETLSLDDVVPAALEGNVRMNFLAKLAMNLIGAAAHSIGEHFPMNRVTEPLVAHLLEHPGCRSWDRVWIDTVGEAFLQPLELFALQQAGKDLFTLDAASVDAIVQKNPALDATALRVLRDGKAYMPYPVVNSAIGGPVDLKGRYELGRFVGYEYTPLYAGPSHVGTVNWSQSGTQPFDFSGSQLQSFGQNSVPVPLKDAPDLISSRHHPLSLTTATGTSSAAFAGLITSSLYSWNSILKMLAGNADVAAAIQHHLPVVSHWPKAVFARAFRHLMSFIADRLPLETTQLELQPQASIWNRAKGQAPVTMNFLDGGNIENYGIMPMLRRKVKKIVVFINTYQELQWQYSYHSVTPNSMDSGLPALFGAFSQQQLQDMQRSEGIDASHSQVFPRDDLEALALTLRNLRFDRGGKVRPDHGALVARSRHQVQKNDWWQIEGGWEVEVLWVYNSQVPAWQSGLDKAVAEALVKADKFTDIGDFPTYNTIRSTLMGMEPLQINALANLGEWMVNSNADQFREMFE